MLEDRENCDDLARIARTTGDAAYLPLVLVPALPCGLTRGG